MELTYPGSKKVINKICIKSAKNIIITIPAEAEVVAFSTHTSSSSNFIAAITSGSMSGGSSGKGKRKYYYFYYYNDNDDNKNYYYYHHLYEYIDYIELCQLH